MLLMAGKYVGPSNPQDLSTDVDLARRDRGRLTGGVDRQLHSVSAGAKSRYVDSHAAAGNPVRPLWNLLPLNAEAGRAIGESKSFRGAAQPADTNLFYRQCEPNRLTR
jgi:hypothetical protein